MNIRAEELLLVGVVIAPILETLLFQALPVWIARLFGAGFATQVVVSVIPFCVVHALEGIATGLAAGLVGGFYFAFTYVHWRARSRWTAFWTTALSHAIHNGIAFVLLLASGELT